MRSFARKVATVGALMFAVGFVIPLFTGALSEDFVTLMRLLGPALLLGGLVLNHRHQTGYRVASRKLEARVRRDWYLEIGAR